MAYSFKQIEAHDPNNPGLVAPNASVTIFEPGDPAKTPLTLTTLDGQPLANPVTVNGLGYGPAFMHATLPQVAWSGGGLTGTFESYEGMRDEAIAAVVAAESAAGEAAASAAQAAAAATAPTDEAVDAAIVRADLPAVVAEVVSTDTTVAQAAATLAQSDAGLVRKTDAAIPQTVEVPLVNVADNTPVTDALIGSDPAGRVPEPFSVGADGRITDAVITAWGDRLGLVPAAPGIVGYGDSMTTDEGSIGTSYLTVLAANLGVDVHDGGKAGQTSTEIAMRQGGLDVWITIPATDPYVANVLPASPRWHPVVVQPADGWKGHRTHGTIAGVPGQLDRTVAGAYTFLRDIAGVDTPVPPETRFIPTEGPQYDTRLHLLRVGRNQPVLELVQRDLRAMVAGIRATDKKFMVLPIYNTSAEPSGSAGYTNIMAINAWMANEFSGNFYDLRGYLIRYGLADAGITPTAGDTTAITEDRIPPSLMKDTTHLNAAGRIVEGNRIAAVITQKGLL